MFHHYAQSSYALTCALLKSFTPRIFWRVLVWAEIRHHGPAFARPRGGLAASRGSLADLGRPPTPSKNLWLHTVAQLDLVILELLTTLIHEAPSGQASYLWSVGSPSPAPLRVTSRPWIRTQQLHWLIVWPRPAWSWGRLRPLAAAGLT